MTFFFGSDVRKADWTERTWKNIAGQAVLYTCSDEMDWILIWVSKQTIRFQIK